MQWRGVRLLSVRSSLCPSVNFCANRFFSQANGRIATKLAQDGLQVSVHPGCAQGQGERSRDTRTFLDSWNELLRHWRSGFHYMLRCHHLERCVWKSSWALECRDWSPCCMRSSRYNQCLLMLWIWVENNCVTKYLAMLIVHDARNTVSTRVVSPEISGNFLRKISGNLFQSFRKFPEIFTKNTVQNFQITVYLFTSSLSIGFYSTSVH